MKSNHVLSIVLLLSALQGCAPGRGNGTTPTGGSTNMGGDTGTTGGSSGSGGTKSSGGSAGTTTQGGSGGTNDGGSGGGGATGGTSSGGVSSGGTAGTTPTGGTAGNTPTGGTAGTTPTGGGGSGGGGSGGGGSGPNPIGPCDIVQAAGNPCAAAHSTVRALYSTYTGPLYQVQRASDKNTKDITPGAGGFADTATQDSFCSGTTCTIPIIYDQSSNGNHLRPTWFSYWMQNGHNPADAKAAKITIAGHTVYGIKNIGFNTNVGYRTGIQLSGTATITKDSATVTFSKPQTLPAKTPLLFGANTQNCPPNSWHNGCDFKAYFTAADINNATTVTLTANYTGTSSTTSTVWNHSTKGVPVGDEPEAVYSVFDAKSYNGTCCFDYGNAELNGIDEGHATMEALYFGASTQFQKGGAGSGPWVGADIEDGMFECDTPNAVCTTNTSITGMAYVTGMLKGKPGNTMVLKAGNAQGGKLETKWNGKRPTGYDPMKKQGAIILATGGDGSQGGTGIWFEGAITVGFTSDATDDALHANIAALGYGK